MLPYKLDETQGDPLIQTPQGQFGRDLTTDGLLVPRDDASYGLRGHLNAPNLLPLNSMGIGALSPIGNGGSSVAVAATYITQYPALGRYVMVRPRFKNYTSSPWTINLFKVASAPTDANDGLALTWVSGTIAGAPGGDVPAAVGSGASVQPGILLGDWIPLSSVARTDVVGALPLLQSRVYAQAGSPQQANAGTVELNASTGLSFKGVIATGDRVTAIDARVPIDGSPFTIYTCCDFEFMYDKKAVSFLDVGDSRAHGAYSNSSEFGPSLAAMKYSIGGPVLIGGANYGVDSAPSSAFHAQLLKMLPVVRPTFASVWFESPNDGNGASPYDVAFARAVGVLQECVANRVIPIVMTPTPRNVSGANLTYWQAAVRRIRDYARAGSFLLLDNALEAEDPNNPGAWKAEYKPTGDATNQHGNEAFYNWQGQRLARLMTYGY